MSIVTCKIIPDLDKNSISYSRNYRIFTATEPVLEAVNIVGFSEDVDFGTGNPNYLSRKFRYSLDGGNWSLWYDFSLTNFSNITTIPFEKSQVFFEFKYEYNDFSSQPLATPIKVNSIKVKVESPFIGESLFTPNVCCSTERSPIVIAGTEASFKPYEVDSAVGISKELSYQVNLMFGHDVVYFKTEPDREGGDFIFKEWTLYQTTDRKCIKVVVPENKFPDNRPSFTEFGVDFEIPFEIHVDHQYFQSMFGLDSQPRKRDYLYFPLVNRMYEIQGSYLFRGFMMEPMYWKIQLTKFHPNIDMLMKEPDRKFLDNIIMSSDELFGTQAEEQKKDALTKQQFKTISHKFDETRRSLHPDLNNRLLDITYNYSPLIEYYYDMSGVVPRIVTYSPASNGNSNDQYLTPGQPYQIYAYEESDIYLAWRNNQLNTGDTHIQGNGPILPVKMNGPKESFSALGKYVVVEGYRTLALLEKDKKSIIANSNNDFQFKQSEHAVIYKAFSSTTNTPSMTFSSIIKFNKGNTLSARIFDGFDNSTNSGIRILYDLSDSAGQGNLTFYIQVNGTQATFPIGLIDYDSWYSVIIPMSGQYGQLSVNVYSFGQDQANIKNYSSVTQVASLSVNQAKFSFDTQQNWALVAGNYSIANIRLFNTMVRPEDHEFIISQLFVRDESLIEIIDNCRPRLNIPFISINK
jgi:hypothetical protein